MLVFSPLFTASCKQNESLVKAVVPSRWMELEAELCGGGGLCCSRRLLSDANPADWCDRKLLDFRGKQSSNPGLKKKSSQTHRSSESRSDVNRMTGNCWWSGGLGARLNNHHQHLCPTPFRMKEALMVFLLISPTSIFIGVFFEEKKQHQTVCW